MKYSLSVESKTYLPENLDGIKWDDLLYPANATDIERAEIDKLVNDEIRDKTITSPLFGHFISGTFNCILDQINIDRQVKLIKDSNRPGLLWFITAKRIG